ncbi:MAG: efflux RND transporter permease subunit [Thiogranum sp.]
MLDREEVEGKHLGIAGRIACTFIDSPISPLLMVATLFIGLLGLVFTPRQEDPQISVPMIDIFVQYPGTSADQVTSLVTEPLERIMYQIPGVRHVYSASQRGQAMVTVRFKVGEPMGASIVKVHDKIQSNLDKMPPGVSMPLVKPKGIDDVPVVTVTLSSGSVDDAALRTLGMDVLQRLREVPDTGQGFVVGGRAEQVRIEVNPERLAGYGLTLDQIAQTVKAANQQLPAGSIESSSAALSVYTGSFLRTADEISRLIVGSRGGLPVYLRDVAKVFHGPEEARQMVSYYTGEAAAEGEIAADGEPAVTIALAKKEGTNGVTVADDILEKLDLLRGHLIPDNVRVSITRDYGKTANDKVNELLTALFEAALAVSILCMIGLGFRAAFVVITVIPIVILITVWSAWVLDYTIDRVSLFALIFSIGILVDDATVVVENIFRRWMEAGRTTVGIAIDAVREVGNPTILATLTIISALLPMGWVSGLMGPYMRPIPVLGASAMFFSLVAAFIFTPWFAVRMRPSSLAAFKKAEAREKRTHEIVGKIYEPLIRPLIKSRPLGILFLLSIIGTTAAVCALFYFQVVAVKMLPFDNKPEFNVVVNLPEGTALPVTANVIQVLAEELRKDMPEVVAMQTYAGTASPFNFNGLVRHYYLRQKPWMGDIQVMLLDKNDRERSSHELSVVARNILTPIAERLGAKIQVVEMPPGPPVLQTVVAEIYGPDAVTRRQTARDMEAMFNEVEGLVDVDTYMADPYTYWHFDVDREKATRNGVSVEDINRNLAMAMGGSRLGDVKRAAPLEPTYIVIQAPLAVRSQVARLANLPIPTSSGKTIPLGELGTFVKRQEDPYIYHQDLRPVEYVTGEMTGFLGAPIYGMFDVEDLLDDYLAPDGVEISGMPWGLLGPPDNDLQSGFEWGGEWTVTYETFRDMGIAFMAAMLLIYGLIVVEFRDYALAGLIMAPIPLTLIGIIPGHWIMGAEFTATSMIGMIALGGIIVRVSILLVEFVKHEVATGKDIREAAVDAAKTRFRPIMITSLTLMAGAMAILTDPIFNGMAVTLLFGTGVATLFTLIVIPMGCISAEKRFIKHGCEALDERLSEEDAAARNETPA